MTLTELKAKAEPILTDFWQTLREYENSYFAKHGHYFQLLDSNTVVDGVDTDIVIRVPSDAQNTLDMLNSYSTKVPFKLRVDVSDGPTGQWYTAHVEAVVGGNLYVRERNSRNEDTGWYKITPATN